MRKPKMNFHAPIHAPTSPSGTIKPTRSRKPISLPAANPLIAEDPKLRSEADWLARKPGSQSSKWMKRLRRHAGSEGVAAFPTLAKLMSQHITALFHLGCVIIVEDDLSEAGTISLPYGDREIETKAALLKHNCETADERRALGTYLAILGERDQWWGDAGAVEALVEGMCAPHVVASVEQMAELSWTAWEGRPEESKIVPTAESWASLAPRLRMAVVVMFKSKDELVSIVADMENTPDTDDPKKTLLDHFLDDLALAEEFAEAMQGLTNSAMARMMGALSVLEVRDGGNQH